MKRLLSRRPSGASLIALVALFVSLGGSAYAAARITGADVVDRSLTYHDIARNSIGYGEVTGLTGHDVRRSSMGGYQVDESTLAKVPSAAKADTAGNANTVGGKAPSDFVASSSLVRVGIVRLTNGQTKQLAQVGPLTITARCTINSGGSDTARIFASTTEPGSLLLGADKDATFGPATPEALSRIAEATTSTTGTPVASDQPFELTAPSGSSTHGQLTAAANSLNGAGACQFTGYVVVG